MAPKALETIIENAGYKVPAALKKWVISSTYHKPEKMRDGFTRRAWREYVFNTYPDTLFAVITYNGQKGCAVEVDRL